MLEINEAARVVHVDGEMVILPAMQFDLLLVLASQPAKVFTDAEIAAKVWGASYVHVRKSMRQTPYRLKRELGNGYMTRVRGVGWRLMPPERVPAGRAVTT
jgi:DNA-binding response OmpR family regulator